MFPGKNLSTFMFALYWKRKKNPTCPHHHPPYLPLSPFLFTHGPSLRVWICKVPLGKLRHVIFMGVVLFFCPFFIYLSCCPLIPPVVTRQCWQMGGLVGVGVSNLSSGLLQNYKGATGTLVLCHLASLLNVTKSPLGIAYLPLTRDGE